ncbi:MAG: lipopolysaccharide biosynthesis protein [Ramlibacter sp.]|jgi:polysaccharide chain length determinant protein (PEP-CTERM system associated)|nr:lipopolysaccharide biosynthesis protein [Ramlibacter sp.]
MNDYQLTLSDYVSIAQRRAWLIAATFAGVLALGTAVALLIPPVYRSSGSILIESQQIPTDIVPGAITSYADERIELLKQRIMTRENLLRLISKHGLFADAGPGFTPTEQVDQLRKIIAVQLMQADHPDRQGPANISFSIAFEHRKPEVAQAVANDLVTLFVQENTKVRTQRAAQTTEFLTQEADKLKKDVDAIAARVSKYKQENAAALPENVALGMASMQRLEADLRQVERDHASAEEALRTVEAERAAVLAEPPPVVAAPADPARAELQSARVELARLASTYTENHPDLKAARRKVEALERAVAALPPPPPRRSNAAVAAARFDGRASGLRERVRVLAAQKATLREKISQMDVTMVRSPQVELGLSALTREYESAQKKYEELLGKKMTAQLAENLEDGQKAERFTVLDAPTLPDDPVKPNRKKLLAMSFILALGAAIGAAALMEALRGVVRGVGQIRAIWGEEPLVSIPVIPLPGEQGSRRRMLSFAGGGTAAALTGLVFVHFLFTPLDQVVQQALVGMV